MIQRKRPIKPFKNALWDGSRWTGTPPQKKPRTAIKKVSKKRGHNRAIYRQRGIWFLAQPENQKCPVAMAGLIPGAGGHCHPHHRQTTQVHHRAGRDGKNFLDESTWLAVSAEGHDFIHHNVAVAYERGWMISRA